MYQVLTAGEIKDQAMTNSIVLAAPAKKLLRLVCKDGR